MFQLTAHVRMVHLATHFFIVVQLFRSFIFVSIRCRAYGLSYAAFFGPKWAHSTSRWMKIDFWVFFNSPLLMVQGCPPVLQSMNCSIQNFGKEGLFWKKMNRIGRKTETFHPKVGEWSNHCLWFWFWNSIRSCSIRSCWGDQENLCSHSKGDYFQQMFDFAIDLIKCLGCGTSLGCLDHSVKDVPSFTLPSTQSLLESFWSAA